MDTQIDTGNVRGIPGRPVLSVFGNTGGFSAFDYIRMLCSYLWNWFDSSLNLIFIFILKIFGSMLGSLVLPFATRFQTSYLSIKLRCQMYSAGTIFAQNSKDFMKSCELIVKVFVCCDWKNKTKALSCVMAIVQVICPYINIVEGVEQIFVRIMDIPEWEQLAENLTKYFGCFLSYIGQSDEPTDTSTINEFEKLWDTVANSDLGIGLMQALSMLVTAGCLPETKINYHNIELFSLEAARKSVKAKDLFATCYSLYKLSMEGVERFKSNGSFSEIFSRESLEAEVSYALSLYQQVLVGNLVEYAGISTQAYISQMNKLKTRLETKVKDPLNRDKLIFRSYLDKVNDVISALSAIELEQKYQEQAFAVMFHGHSSVGKSWFALPAIKWLLKINDYEHEDRNIITYNTSSKYDDQVRNDTYGILLDDLANGKPGNSAGDSRRTSDLVISIINNVAQAAVKADLAEKGKVLMKPKIVIATTNNRELNAKVESTNPASVKRRFRYEIEFKVKPEFRISGSSEIDGDKVSREFPGKQFPNCWDFSVTKCIITSPQQGKGGGYEMAELSNPYVEGSKVFEILDLLRFLKEESLAHFTRERKSLELRKSQKSIEVNESGLPKELFEGQSLEDMFSYMSTMFSGDESDDEALEWEGMTEIYRIYESWRGYNTIEHVPYLVSRLWILSEFNLQKFIGYMVFLSLILPISLLLITTKYSTVLALSLWLVQLWCIKDFTVATMARTIALTSLDLRMRRAWRTVANEINHERALRKAVYLFGGMTGLYIVSKFLSRAYSGNSLDPKNTDEVKERISSPSLWSIFRGVVGNTAKGITSNMTPNDMINRFQNNLAYIQVAKENGLFRGTNALFVKKGYILLPYHFFKQCSDTFTMNIMRGKRTEEVLVDKRAYKERKQWQKVTEDLVLIRVTGVNRCRNIVELFSARQRDDPMAFGKEPYYLDGEIVVNAIENIRKMSKTYQFAGDSYVCNGYIAKSECVPKGGMCMAPIVVDARGPEIIGLHIAGNEGAKQVLVMSVTQDMLNETITKLESCCVFQDIDDSYAFTAHSNSCTSHEIHKFCATKFASNSLPIDVIGTVPGSGPRKMTTTKTPYHDLILEDFKMEDPYGIPKSKASIRTGELMSPWKNCIEELNAAKNLIPYSLLERARAEIVDKFTNNLDTYIKAGGIVRPLNTFEAINGIDGYTGLDGMKMATAAGIKYGGTKSSHLEKETHPYKFNDYVLTDVKNLRQLLANKTRGVNTLNASLKDEALKKKKVDSYRTRVFFSDEMDSLIVCGQLFSPILAYLRTYPESSHCAIGLNAQSHDWEKIYDYLTDNGRISPEDGLCLDFKAFDKTLPENLMKFAWQVLIDIAKQMPGYTEEDIRMMTTIADEKTTPFIRMNGTLMQLNFDHTSGNFCTAAVGSIAGLMLLLIGFYEIDDPNGCSVKGLDYIRSIHLGDDLTSAIDCKHKLNFNFLTLEKVLKNFGITITMPDKEATPTPYQNFAKEDFLKRTFRYCPDRESILGVLDRSSMMKSLLYYTPSQVETKQNQLGQSLSALLIETSLYGKEEFEKMRSLVSKLKTRYYLNVPNFDMTYEDRVIHWARDSGKRYPTYQARPKEYIKLIVDRYDHATAHDIFGGLKPESFMEFSP